MPARACFSLSFSPNEILNRLKIEKIKNNHEPRAGAARRSDEGETNPSQVAFSPIFQRSLQARQGEGGTETPPKLGFDSWSVRLSF